MSFKSLFFLIFILIPMSHVHALVEEMGGRDNQIAGILQNCSQENLMEQGRCYEDSLRALIGVQGFDPEALASSLDERAQSTPGTIRFDFITLFAEWSFEASTTGEVLDKCFTSEKRIFNQVDPLTDLVVSVGGTPIIEVKNETINPLEFCKVLLNYGLESDLKREIHPDRFYVFSQIWRRNSPGVTTSLSGVFSSKDDFISACLEKADSELTDEADEYSVIVTDGLRDWSNTFYDSKHYWSNRNACDRVANHLH